MAFTGTLYSTSGPKVLPNTSFRVWYDCAGWNASTSGHSKYIFNIDGVKYIRQVPDTTSGDFLGLSE